MQTKKLIALFLYVFLVLSLIPIQVGADTATFGSEVQGADGEGAGARIYGCLFSCPQAGTGIRISADIRGLAGNVNMKGALYLHSDLSYVANSTTDTVVVTNARQWNDFPFTVAPNLIATDYLISIWSEGDAAWYYNAGAVGQTHVDVQAFGAWPDPLVPTVSKDYEMPFHCDYTPSASGQNLTFGLAENIYPSRVGYFQKALGFQLSETAYYFTTQLLGKELLFRPTETIRFFDSAILPIGVLTIDMAVAIGVLALVLSITGISMVFLRRRRD